jgi:hypothetical protein
VATEKSHKAPLFLRFVARATENAAVYAYNNRTETNEKREVK